MPSLAVDRLGNMAIGYSVSSATMYPAIRYAGRLAADPVNTFTQTETTLFDGTGAQVGNCGGALHALGRLHRDDARSRTAARSGTRTSTTPADGLNHHTRIGSFRYPGCTDLPSPTSPPITPDPSTGTETGPPRTSPSPPRTRACP